MMGNGSLDSMDKSVLSSEASFEAFDQNPSRRNEYQQPQTSNYNEYVNHNTILPITSRQAPRQEPQKVATIGSASKATANRGRAVAAALAYEQNHPDSFELSYRNEGFRDNSTYGGNSPHTSVANSIAEDTPIIHQIDPEDAASDYYGNSSTLPLRNGGNPSLAFLSELKQNLPEYSKNQDQSHSSFLPGNNTSRPSSNSQYSNASYNSNTLPYEQKIDQLNFTPLPETSAISNDSIIRHDNSIPQDIRRPQSYYTAVRSSKAQPQVAAAQISSPPTTKAQQLQQKQPSKRPKTLYDNSPTNSGAAPLSNGMNGMPAANSGGYHRSKSEALLETDFDDETPSMQPLSTNGRSYSQPLETAM